jgi:hypothetical protein
LFTKTNLFCFENSIATGPVESSSIAGESTLTMCWHRPFQHCPGRQQTSMSTLPMLEVLIVDDAGKEMKKWQIQRWLVDHWQI